jgi:hypothetical protein
MLNSVIKYITGIIKIKGGSDGTKIGNIGDKLKTTTEVTSSVLPTGAATAVKQDTGNASLALIKSDTANISTNTSNIDSKIPAGMAVTGDRLKVDALLSTGGATQTIIDLVHQRCHEGRYFTHSSTHLNIADDASIDHLVVTSATAPHMAFAVSVMADFTLTLYEDTVTSADGAAAYAFNNNRNSAVANTTLIYEAPTVTSIGTKLAETLLPAGKGGNAIGGTDGAPVRTGTEIILKSNTKYLFRVTNKSGQTREFTSVSFGWYE